MFISYFSTPYPPEPIAAALADIIPCTIGMSGAITDDAAIAFATAFYRGLGFGRNIQEAFDLGKNSLLNLQIPEDEVPRLYSRNGAHVPSRSCWSDRRSPCASEARHGHDPEPPGDVGKGTDDLDCRLPRTALLFQETPHLSWAWSERTDIVARPLDLLVKRANQGERPLPPGTPVVDVYDTMDVCC